MPSYKDDQIEIHDQARPHQITDIALVSAESSTDHSMAHILLCQQHFNMSPDYDHEPIKKHKTIPYFHESSED